MQQTIDTNAWTSIIIHAIGRGLTGHDVGSTAAVSVHLAPDGDEIIIDRSTSVGAGGSRAGHASDLDDRGSTTTS